MLLVAVSIPLRRWLVKGPGAERRGFTPTRALASDGEAIARLGTLTIAIPRDAPVDTQAPSAFNGGRSGGRGAEF